MKRTDRFKTISQKLVYLVVAAFIGYFVFLAFSRHDNFYSRRVDLGNMDQTVWNVLHGNGFTLTDPMGTAQESRLAVHADFLLIFMAPFYLIWSNPKMLLLIQTTILGLGAIPVFWLARDKLKSLLLAFLFVLAYLLYPPQQRLNLHDFHAVVLSGSFLLFAYWYMKKDNLLLFSVFAILAGLGKEQVWLTTGLMGLYFVITKRHIAFGAIVAAVSFLIFYLLFWIFIPKVTPVGQHWALQYLSEFGENQNQILKHIFTEPLIVVRDIFAPDRLFYYFQLLFPFGFLSLLSPLTLIYSAPSLAINVLSNNNLFRQIDYQYTSTITPWIVIASIEGYAVLQKFIKTFARRYSVIAKKYEIACVYFIITVLTSSFLWGELPYEKSSRFFYFTGRQTELQTMKAVEREVDKQPQKTVSVTNNIGAHFSQREFLYNYPVNAQTADYSIIYLGDPYAWPSGDEQKRVLQQLLKNNRYQLFAQQGNFYAFRRVTI